MKSLFAFAFVTIISISSNTAVSYLGVSDSWYSVKCEGVCDLASTESYQEKLMKFVSENCPKFYSEDSLVLIEVLGEEIESGLSTQISLEHKASESFGLELSYLQVHSSDSNPIELVSAHFTGKCN